MQMSRKGKGVGQQSQRKRYESRTDTLGSMAWKRKPPAGPRRNEDMLCKSEAVAALATTETTLQTRASLDAVLVWARKGARAPEIVARSKTFAHAEI